MNNTTSADSTKTTMSFEEVSGLTVDGPIIYETHCTIPEGIAVGKTPYGYGVFCTRAMKKGEVLYAGNTRL